LLLKRDSVCSAIQRGKGQKLLVCLRKNRVPREKWHTVLGNSSLCSAIASGRPVDLERRPVALTAKAVT
jgi:hypothetical protein